MYIGPKGRRGMLRAVLDTTGTAVVVPSYRNAVRCDLRKTEMTTWPRMAVHCTVALRCEMGVTMTKWKGSTWFCGPDPPMPQSGVDALESAAGRIGGQRLTGKEGLSGR